MPCNPQRIQVCELWLIRWKELTQSNEQKLEEKSAKHLLVYFFLTFIKLIIYQDASFYGYIDKGAVNTMYTLMK